MGVLRGCAWAAGRRLSFWLRSEPRLQRRPAPKATHTAGFLPWRMCDNESFVPLPGSSWPRSAFPLGPSGLARRPSRLEPSPGAEPGRGVARAGAQRPRRAPGSLVRVRTRSRCSARQDGPWRRPWEAPARKEFSGSSSPARRRLSLLLSSGSLSGQSQITLPGLDGFQFALQPLPSRIVIT